MSVHVGLRGMVAEVDRSRGVVPERDGAPRRAVAHWR